MAVPETVHRYVIQLLVVCALTAKPQHVSAPVL